MGDEGAYLFLSLLIFSRRCTEDFLFVVGKNVHCSPHRSSLEPYYPGSAVRSGPLSEKDSPPSSSSPSSPLRQQQPFVFQASSVFLPSFWLFCLVSLDFSHFQARETWSSWHSVLLKSFAYGKDKTHFPKAGNSIFPSCSLTLSFNEEIPLSDEFRCSWHILTFFIWTWLLLRLFMQPQHLSGPIIANLLFHPRGAAGLLKLWTQACVMSPVCGSGLIVSLSCRSPLGCLFAPHIKRYFLSEDCFWHWLRIYYQTHIWSLVVLLKYIGISFLCSRFNTPACPDNKCDKQLKCCITACLLSNLPFMETKTL